MKLTGQQFRDLIKKGNVTIDYEHSILAKKSGNPVAELPPTESEPSAGGKLQAASQAQAEGQGSLRYRVLIIRCGARLLDSDNVAGGGAKWLRDAIAQELNIDDGDPAIEWEYGQVRTRGSLGTIVRIERL